MSRFGSFSTKSTTIANQNIIHRNFKVLKKATPGVHQHQNIHNDCPTTTATNDPLKDSFRRPQSVQNESTALIEASSRSSRQELELSTLSDTEEYFFNDSDDGEVFFELEISTDDDEDAWEEKTVDTEELWDEEKKVGTEDLWEEETVDEELIYSDKNEIDTEATAPEK